MVDRVKTNMLARANNTKSTLMDTNKSLHKTQHNKLQINVKIFLMPKDTTKSLNYARWISLRFKRNFIQMEFEEYIFLNSILFSMSINRFF
jgi:hypothetical protein